MILEKAPKLGAVCQPPLGKNAALSAETGNSSGGLPPGRASVFGKAPVPHQVFNVSFQRVPAGESTGYAIISNGCWLGTLSGEEGRAFRDYLVSLPRDEIYAGLVKVARRMAADLHSGHDANSDTAGQS